MTPTPPEQAASTLQAQGSFIAQADRGGTAMVNIGIPSSELPGIISAATKSWEDLTDKQQRDLDRVRAQLDVSAGALQRFLQDIGEADVPAEGQAAKLAEIAHRYKDLQAQIAAAPEHDPTVAHLRGQAKEALASGDLDRADALLGEVQKAQDAEADKSALEAAATSAQRAEIALTRLRYLDAAALLAAATARVPAGHEMERHGYLDRQAAALYRQGDEKGDNAALGQAIALYRDLLEERTRARVPLQWATTQMSLGNALAVLGERESGTARLEQAVVAYHAALEEMTRARVPLQWATTQNNLGNALKTLGERESGTERLEQAVAAYHAALEEMTRARVPLQWATTQMNLGIALQTLGERESGTERLEQAVAAYQAALEERTRARVPLDWARTQNNLGTALQTLGARSRRKDLLAQALEAIRNAQAGYVEAALRQYDFYLNERVNSLENAIAAMADD